MFFLKVHMYISLLTRFKFKRTRLHLSDHLQKSKGKGPRMHAWSLYSPLQLAPIVVVYHP